MSSKKTIVIIDEFSKKPYGRYTRELQPGEEDTTGERFRKDFLAPALRKYDHVHVDLTGYNRYGPSFIDEAFGGLIYSKEFSSKEILNKLTYEHKDLPSIEVMIADRINNAIQYEEKN